SAVTENLECPINGETLELNVLVTESTSTKVFIGANVSKISTDAFVEEECERGTMWNCTLHISNLVTTAEQNYNLPIILRDLSGNTKAINKTVSICENLNAQPNVIRLVKGPERPQAIDKRIASYRSFKTYIPLTVDTDKRIVDADLEGCTVRAAGQDTNEEYGTNALLLNKRGNSPLLSIYIGREGEPEIPNTFNLTCSIGFRIRDGRQVYANLERETVTIMLPTTNAALGTFNNSLQRKYDQTLNDIRELNRHIDNRKKVVQVMNVFCGIAETIGKIDGTMQSVKAGVYSASLVLQSVGIDANLVWKPANKILGKFHRIVGTYVWPPGNVFLLAGGFGGQAWNTQLTGIQSKYIRIGIAVKTACFIYSCKFYEAGEYIDVGMHYATIGATKLIDKWGYGVDEAILHRDKVRAERDGKKFFISEKQGYMMIRGEWTSVQPISYDGDGKPLTWSDPETGDLFKIDETGAINEIPILYRLENDPTYSAGRFDGRVTVLATGLPGSWTDEQREAFRKEGKVIINGKVYVYIEPKGDPTKDMWYAIEGDYYGLAQSADAISDSLILPTQSGTAVRISNGNLVTMSPSGSYESVTSVSDTGFYVDSKGQQYYGIAGSMVPIRKTDAGVVQKYINGAWVDVPPDQQAELASATTPPPATTTGTGKTNGETTPTDEIPWQEQLLIEDTAYDFQGQFEMEGKTYVIYQGIDGAYRWEVSAGEVIGEAERFTLKDGVYVLDQVTPSSTPEQPSLGNIPQGYTQINNEEITTPSEAMFGRLDAVTYTSPDGRHRLVLAVNPRTQTVKKVYSYKKSLGGWTWDSESNWEWFHNVTGRVIADTSIPDSTSVLTGNAPINSVDNPNAFHGDQVTAEQMAKAAGITQGDWIINPYKSVYYDGLCLPAKLYNYQKEKEIKCMYAQCLKTVAVTGQSSEVCEDQYSVRNCLYLTSAQVKMHGANLGASIVQGLVKSITNSMPSLLTSFTYQVGCTNYYRPGGENQDADFIIGGLHGVMCGVTGSYFAAKEMKAMMESKYFNMPQYKLADLGDHCGDLGV
ncbi:MAG: hypothetical protein V1725_02750, partial [archaeon]